MISVETINLVKNIKMEFSQLRKHCGYMYILCRILNIVYSVVNTFSGIIVVIASSSNTLSVPEWVVIICGSFTVCSSSTEQFFSLADRAAQYKHLQTECRTTEIAAERLSSRITNYLQSYSEQQGSLEDLPTYTDVVQFIDDTFDHLRDRDLDTLAKLTYRRLTQNILRPT